MQRTRSLYRLSSRKFDLLVIGGGISGACIAHDAALRGFSVALVEKQDFGAFTSAASSKLLHGGIRYLPKGQLWKVRESGREQRLFHNLAPHLIQWVPFLIPTQKYSLMQGALPLKAAMKVYGCCHRGLDALVEDSSRCPPSGDFVSPEELCSLAPQLSSLTKLSGAQVLFESHMHSSERMTLAFLKTALSNGAELANYLEVNSYINLSHKHHRVQGVMVKDLLSDDIFPISAELTINAAGPGIPLVNGLDNSLPLYLHKEITGFSRGVHLVTRQIHPHYAFALTTLKQTDDLVNRGGRHIFIIPWRGWSLIGTTNVPFTGDFSALQVSRQDVEDFLVEINACLPDLHLSHQDVHYAYTGIYPLTASIIEPEKYQGGSGDYQIIDHGCKDGVAGLITALGTKYTTARHLAEKTVDLAAKKLGVKARPCHTHSSPLLEGNIRHLASFISRKQEQYSSLLPPEYLIQLIRQYGRDIDRVMGLAVHEPELLQPLSPQVSTCKVEILYAVQREMAMTLEDALFRRTALGTLGRPDDQALDQAAEIMADALDWDNERVQQEKEQVLSRYRFQDA
jgi:glycerol-3-phosphate dehydrogenase